jgi:filamentous hemagglutinin
METRYPPVRFSQRLISWVVCGLMVWQPMVPAMAAALTPTGKTTTDKAGNGVPIVNIATPNGAGISHNQFTQYNVGKEGLILNNATNSLTQTQLGGLIQNNPNLQAGREAKGIINEVTGTSRSQLQGYTEVAGKAANVMVANPYGITCNGCGFINTPNVTLTTGKPQLDANGNLLTLDVTKGAITIEGQGLDASKNDALSLIARATEVNAAIHARDLTVTAGANRVGADGSIKPLAGEGAAPTIAVDTGALGGMYANRIRLVSSDKGVGVNLGNLNARQGDIQLDASGKLTVTNSLASGTITAKGAGVALNGSHQAGGAMSVTSSQEMVLNNSTLASTGEIHLASDGKLQITGGGASSKRGLTVTSGQDMVLKDASLVAANSATLASQGKLTQTGGGVSGQGGALTVTGKAGVALSDATLVGQDNTALATDGTLSVKGGSLTSKGGMDVRGGQGITLTNATLGSDARTTLTSGGSLMASASAMSAGGDLTLNGAGLTIDSQSRADATGSIALNGDTVAHQGQASAGKDLTIVGKNVTNGGQLAAKGRLDVHADTLINSGTLQGNAVTLQGQTLTNSGTLQSGGRLALTADTLNQRGTLGAKGDATLVVKDTLTNAGSTLADGTLSLKATTLNQQGTLSGAKGLTAETGVLTSTKDSRTLSQGDMQLAASQRADLSGLTDAAGQLDLNASTLVTQQDARLQSGQQLTLQAGRAELNGILAAKGALNVSSDTLVHAGKSTGKQLEFRAAQALTNSGELTADAITLSGQAIDQSGIAKADSLTLTAPQAIANSGTLAANTLFLESRGISNSGLLQGSTLLNLQADTLTNFADGALYSAQDLTLTIPTFINSGLIATDGTLRLMGTALENQGEINGVSLEGNYTSLSNLGAGRLLADDRITLNGTTLTNEGQIAANSLQLTGNSLQNAGLIQGDNGLTLNVVDTTNSGTLQSGGALDLRGNTLTNSGELSATELLLNLTQQVNNDASGRAIARDGLTLTTAVLRNSGLLAGKNTQLNSDAITNSGTLQGTATLTAIGKQLSNLQAGMMLAGGGLDLQNATLNNAGLLQGKTLNLATGEWINSGNALGEAGVTAKVAGTLTNQGKVLSQQTLDVDAGSLDNRGQLLAKVLTLHGDLQNSGLLQGSSDVRWRGNSFTNQALGQVTGGETLSLTGKSLINQGQIQAQRATLSADNLTNGGAVQTLDNLTLTLTGKVDNQGALLSQNLFDLTAAQLFNAGQLAGKALSLSAPDITNNGILQGNERLQLTARTVLNDQHGQLVSGSGLDLNLDRLDNAGLLLVGDDFTLQGNALTNRGEIQADNLNLRLNTTLTSQGNILASNGATLNAATLTNSGTLAGKTLDLTATELRNSGLVQGNNALDAAAARFINEATGKWLSDGGLTLNGGQVSNAGTLQGGTLAITGSALTNGGTLNGQAGLTGTFTGTLNNTGLLQSAGNATLTVDSLINPGRMLGGTLMLNGRDLNNTGLWQGTHALTVTGDTLATGATSRTLTSGLLTLDAGQLTTQGTLQGNGVDVSAAGWTHSGSLLSQGALTATTGGTLTSTGSVMSQGEATITAQTLDNRGQILSEGDVTLGGSTLKNSGTVQGKTLGLQQSSINNQGTLTGLQSLTLLAQQALMARMAMAAPQQTLINGASGKLLTQGTLNITSGDVDNAGSWQAQNILVNARSLTNGGAIQSADGLQMTLADTLTATTGSKITALGAATLQAASLINQGQWTAKNLTLKGGALSNSGAVSGVNGLTLSLTGAVTQQSGGTLLTGGALNLNAAAVSNDGKIQGATLGITTGALTNNGRLQGDNGATLTLSGTLTNNAAGEIVSRNALTVTTPTLFNYGLLQGGGETLLKATSQARNDGKVLSGARLTLTTPQYAGSGWLQATDLILNAATATNGNGTWIADRATLTGTTFTNQGSTQAGTLAVNYNQLSNSGTLLGNTQLNIDADRVTQSANGKLLSGGDLWLESKGLDVVGQLVSLGNLTLKLTSAFTSTTAIAAGKTLAITSSGDIDNRSVMQGQAVNLTAGGQLINNGQITTGSGSSTLSGSSVALNAAGSVQGGGDITVASRGNITVDGFTGTRGSLTLSAPGSIVNTALLYAANNLALYANTIANQRGDIMAGNSLVMQKDTAGNASAQIVNTSGNIETQNGDMTIKTGSLLNTRDGLSVNSWTETSQLAENVGDATIELLVRSLPSSAYELKHSITKGYRNCTCAIEYDIYGSSYAPTAEAMEQRYAGSVVHMEASANGGAGRISSGRDLIINAGTLDNQSSLILSGRNATLTGSQLNNESYQSGTTGSYYIYKYFGSTGGTSSEWGYQSPSGSSTFIYKLDGITSETVQGETLRAVIQAGGNVTANFTNNISNTNTTSNAGGVSNVISTPSLNTLSNQTLISGAQKQNLTNAGTVAVGSPQWNDQLQGALQQLNGGGALDNSSATNTSLSNIATTQKGNANLGQLGALANAGVTTADLNTAKGSAGGQYQGQRVDTSAYPLPSGNNGYFVVSDNPKSPYLININPKLNELGQLDPALFADLNAMLGTKPASSAPQETRAVFTDEKQFLGSSYMLGRLDLNPDYDYRFLGDAAFDTRYVSNAVLNETGNRYLNGIGSDLDQMRYLMDSAAAAQQSLGLQFGVSLTADQIAALDHSILWWEQAVINGETVMVPKLYLSPKDVTLNNGSVIAGNNVTLKSGEITNSGSTLLAGNNLTLDSQNSISNLNDSLIKAGGDLNLSAIGDINNISSTISGKTVALESADGSINNLTLAEQIAINAKGKYDNVSLKETFLGSTASITAQDSLSLEAGKNITVTGASLAAGGDMLLNAWGDIAVNANQVNDAYSSATAKTGRASVSYEGSSVSAGGNLVANAGNNMDVTASDLKAGGGLGLRAGNDLNLNAEQTSESNRSGKSESHGTGLDRTTLSAGENLVLKAGQDINAQAAALAAEESVGLQAGRDVNLNAQATTEGDSYKASKKTVINESVRQQGTEIASGGDTAIVAGRDVTAEAAQVTAKGDIAVAAGRDVDLNTATESDYYYKEQTKTKSGFLSKKTTHTIEESSATREAGTLLSGDNVQVTAGNNLLVQGSSVVGDGTVGLTAGNNVDIVAATNSNTDWRFKETKKSGLMGTGGIGFTIGSSKSTHDLRESGTTQSQSFSTVGSTGGDVSITAGNQLHVGGADLVAGKDMSLTGDSVMIEPGHDKRTRDETFEQKSSGLTVALSGVVGSTINSAVTTAQEATKESDGRLAALQATKAALSGVQAGQGAVVAQQTGDPSNGFGVSLSLTTQKSKSQQHAESDTVAGSTLNAGDNLAINATGKGNSANSGDILIGGSQLKAGGDTTLNAENDILLTGAANTQKTTGKNSSSGGGVGVSIGAGSGGAGISVFANVNAAKGNEKGNGTAWTETTIDSGGTVSMTSGRDAILNGAQVNGEKIVADIGRDLWLSSQQDSNDYKSKQTSVAAGGSFTFGSMTGSGYISANQDKMKSTFDSVQEQTGLFAGDGGFDVTVGRHTQLDGAVIASTATADKNSLDTGTLGFSDLHNEADYKVSHTGVSLSGSGSFGDTFKGNLPGGMIAAAGSSGHAEGTTQAAVAEGSITVRDKASQQQDLANLSRDTVNANDSISPIFDKEKEQNRLKAVGLISDIGSQAADIARTQGDIYALDAAKKALGPLKANATEKERQDYVAALRNSPAYQEEMKSFGTGSNLQRGIQAATAALQGLAGGNVAGALAGASAPELAHLIKSTEDDPVVNTLAHAILGGAVAVLQGNNAAAGAMGAAAGELAAKAIMAAMYPGKSASDLNESEKQTISTLASISAGMAGGLVGDSTASAGAGAQAGKNAVENNLMGGSEDAQAAWIRQHGLDMASCSDDPDGAACQKAKNERDAVGLALATGGVALLPGGAQVMWGLGAGANAGVSYWADGTIDPANAAIAGWVNVFSMGNQLVGTVAWNAAGGALGNWIDDKDPLTGAVINGVGSGIGYGIGNGIKWGVNAGANWWKGGWDPKFNPELQKYTEIKGDFGISKEVTPSNIPGSFGDISASYSSEYGGKKLEPIIEDKLK